MKGILDNACWIIEYAMVVVCLYTAFNKKVRISMPIVVIAVANNILLELISEKIFKNIIIITIYAALFIYLYKSTRETLLGTLSRFVIGMLEFLILEVIAGIVAFSIEKYIKNSIMAVLAASSISLVFVFGIKKKTSSWIEKMFEVTHKKKIINWLLLSIGIFSFFFFDSRIALELNIKWYVFLMILVCCMQFIYFRLEITKKELQSAQTELEINKVYGKTYQDLIMEVRKRQHDYKNQLSAIYSMGMVATSLEELVEMQKEYAESLEKSNKYDQILTKCVNPILAGYLYYKCLKIEKDGIEIDFSVSIVYEEGRIPLYELIELLGIFIDNAAEYLLGNEKKKNKILLLINESESTIDIQVGNPSEVLSSKEIGKIFQTGYSTKGENRGLGLSRARQISERYNMQLIVSNNVIDDENWLLFHIIFDK